MKRVGLFCLLLIFLTPLSLSSRSNLSKDWEEADEDVRRAMQQMMEMFQKMKGELRQVMPEFQKMKQDPRFQKRLQEYRKEAQEGKEPWKKIVADEREFFLRARWNYGSERHDFIPPEDPQDPPTYWDTHVAMQAEVEFSGRLTKFFRYGPDQPKEYDFDLSGDQKKIKMATVSYSFRHRREGGEAQFQGDTWEPWPKQLFSRGPVDKIYLVDAVPGIHIGDARCTSYGPTASFLQFPMIEADLDLLLKEGFWQKTYQGIHLPEMEISDLKDWKNFPTEKLIRGEFLPNTLYPKASLSIEIFLEPKIEGPHFIALPMQTSDPETEVQANVVTLKVAEIPGWQTSEIKPVKGWQEAQRFVAKKGDAPPPAPTLTLAPFSPGKVAFEIEWTSPEGKKGKSKPFEVTVVELRFQKSKNCSGFDEKYEEENNIPAMSNCVGYTSYADLTAKPPGVSVRTLLTARGKEDFKVDPPETNTFPTRVTLVGQKKTKQGFLTASIEVDENWAQKGAEVMVDVLEEQRLKILPLNLKADPLDIWDETAVEFEKAGEILLQTCVRIDKMNTETVQAKDIASYQDGETVVYNSPSTEILESYADQNFKKGQELTAYFVPHIGTELWNNAQSRSIKLDDPLGFQHKKFVFISEVGLRDPTLIAHEIGHYLFGDLYSKTEMPGAIHTQDPMMVMYATEGNGCEIRIKEWRRCLEGCPSSK